MSKLISYREGRWATIRTDNGDPCRVIISRSGISVKKSSGRFFGSVLYKEKNIYKVAKTAQILRLLYTNNLTPPGIRNWLLKSFVNIFLHCSALTEAITILKEISDCIEERTRDVSFFRNILSLSDRLRAEKGLASSDDVETATVSVVVHIMTLLLTGTGQPPIKSSADSACEVEDAVLLSFVSSPLILGLRQEGFVLSAADITGKSGLAIFHLYQKEEVDRVVAEGTYRHERLIELRDEMQDIGEFSDSVDRLVYAYVVSGNEHYIWILDKIYASFLNSHAPLIQKYAERFAANAGKRRHKRFSVASMRVNAKTLFAAETNLRNISTSGACVVSKKSVKFGGKHLIKLESEGIRLSIPCTVVWETLSCGSNNSGQGIIPAYRTGIAFQDMTSDKLVKLKDFIRVSGIPNEQRLSDEYRASALRFTVCSNEKAVLLYPKKSPVRKISLSGMLIESNNSAQVEGKFPMALFLPDEALPIRFQGRVASCVSMPDGKPKRFGVGIEFIYMAESERSKVSKFLCLLEEKTELSHFSG
jgi:hypothetical protein